MLYSFCLSEALNLLQTNISTADTITPNLDSTITIEAHLTDEEYVTEWAQLWEAWRWDLLVIMSSYKSSHIDVKNTITWAVIQVKHYYNMNQQPQFFVIRDKVLLRLHCEYKLSEITNWKLKQQFIKPFKVTEQIKCLIYCLDLSSVWKIQNIILIAHLEPASWNNLYNWAQSMNLSAVSVDRAEAENHYEIERLLQKWVSC